MAWNNSKIFRILVLIASLSLAAPVSAQEMQDEGAASPAPAQGTQTGRTATVAGGEVGQRQTRQDAAPNVAPTGRIANRIENRVQNRIRNRIDRYYDPQANAASPFEVASEQARTAGRRAPPR